MKMKRTNLTLFVMIVLGIVGVSWAILSSVGRFSRWEPFGGGIISGMSPSVSPDGKYVIYSSPSTGRGDIYRVNIDGSGTIRLTDHPDYDGDARYSSDGKLICFIREHRGLGKLWVMNADGSGQRQVTRGDYYDSGPAFSPDGSRLVFARIRRWDRALGSAALTDLWTVGIEGGELTRLTDNRVADWEASFSPDGRSILYCVWSKNVHVMRADGSDQRVLTAGSSPAYSPDGRRIVFIFTEEGYGAHSLWLANSDGSGRARIFRSDVYKSSPSFLPDGTRIIYLEHPSDHERKAGRICTIKTDGSDRKVVTEILPHVGD
jgi:Tol biopolymer transport system component